MSGKGALGFSSTLYGIDGASERHKKGVPLGIDLMPIPFPDRGAQNFVMLTQCHCISITQLFEQPCGSFDVREKKRDRSGGLCCAARCSCTFQQAIMQGACFGGRVD